MKKQIKKNTDKKITIEDLAGIVQRGFAEQDKKTDKKIEDLAGMVRRGFDGVNDKFNEVDKRFDLIETKFDRKFIAIENHLDGMGERIVSVEDRLISLEKGQEEIKMKLDNVVYRTEFLNLQKRIEVLEKTIGVKN